MANPREAFGEIIDWVGLDRGSMPFTEESTLRMVRSHTVMGNPNRHTEVESTLRVDSRWVDKLGRRDRVMTTALGSPLMLRYGYPLRSKAAAAGVPVTPSQRG